MLYFPSKSKSIRVAKSVCCTLFDTEKCFKKCFKDWNVNMILGIKLFKLKISCDRNKIYLVLVKSLVSELNISFSGF